MSPRLSVAVVGGGAAGIAAAHTLARTCEVTLFERGEALGGHARSVTVGDRTVDTGVLIFNDATYPTFLSFLEELGVRDQVVPAEMSVCFSNVDRGVHFSIGQRDRRVLAPWSYALRPSILRMLVDLVRLRRRARRDQQDRERVRGVPLGRYLADYSSALRENLLYPLTAAIWSLPQEHLERYPVATLLDYFDNHDLLAGRGDRRWCTFRNSSKVYLDAFQRAFTGELHLATAVRAVSRVEDGVALETHSGAERFDRVVLATHADVSLRLLAAPTAEEAALLGSWRYSTSQAVLHEDPSVLHPDRRYWSSWNVSRRDGHYHISYLLDRVHGFQSETPFILSLGDQRIDPGAVHSAVTYQHPIFDQTAVATQAHLPRLNRDGIAFCGSYHGYGFHEDAFASGVRAARAVVERAPDGVKSNGCSRPR